MGAGSFSEVTGDTSVDAAPAAVDEVERVDVVDTDEVDPLAAVAPRVSDVDRIDLAALARGHRELRSQDRGRIDHAQDFASVAIEEYVVFEQAIADPHEVIAEIG